MRHRSRRMEAVYRQRRRVVAALLADQPVCERCQQAYATDVHELLPRGRGGSILDRDNLVVLCRGCHDRITDHTAPDWRDWIRDSDGRGQVA